MPSLSSPPSAPPAPTEMDAPRLEELVRAHQTAVWRYLRILGCAPDVADDLTQDAFVVALGREWRDRTPPEAEAFLRSTARHLWMRHQRDSRRRAELLAQTADRVWDRDCAADRGDGWLEALAECVAGLEHRAQRCVRGFYGEGLSRAALAEALGMKVTGIKTLLQRTRQALRACVQRRLRP